MFGFKHLKNNILLIDMLRNVRLLYCKAVSDQGRARHPVIRDTSGLRASNKFALFGKYTPVFPELDTRSSEILQT